MKGLRRLAATGAFAALSCALPSEAFSSQRQTTRSASQCHPQTRLHSTAIAPSETSTIGTVGSGYLPVLAAKLAAHRGHGKSWIICPAADLDVMTQLASTAESEALPSNLELVPNSDTDRIDELLRETDAMLIATDDVDSVLAPSVVEYVLDPEKASKIKRVVAMSRNLNGSGMGMLVAASRKAANAQVWDNANSDAYRQYERTVQEAASKCGADWTIVRAGTLKGGACGENNAYPQYLAESYYELTKSDIVAWQLLFDCDVRGVKLAQGDTMSGPGMGAVFAATGSGEHAGDSGRCGVAEAMVRSLEMNGAAGVDFGVGTVKSREVPSEEEWAKMFRECLPS